MAPEAAHRRSQIAANLSPLSKAESAAPVGSDDLLALFDFLIEFASLFLAQANAQVSAIATHKGQW